MSALAEHSIFAERYENPRMIGAGGMGEVNLAATSASTRCSRSNPARTPRASSSRPAGEQTAADFAARFEREARAIARLDHPGCVRVLDHGRDADGHQYIAMELLDGPTLASALATRPARRSRARSRSRASLLARSRTRTRTASSTATSSPRTSILAHAAPVLIDFGLARAARRGRD